MRDIKFRAWRKEDQKMLYGRNATSHPLFTPNYMFQYNEIELMQFTGLKDKNGKDIYEGDIIDLHQTINGVSKFSVEWSQKRMGWTLRYAENMKNPRTYEYDVADVFTVEEIEVIGNIHENSAQ